MEIRLQASKTLKFSTQEEADHQLHMISDTEESHSVALLADPIREKIDLAPDIKSEKIAYLSCCGDSEDSGSVLDFSWIQDLRRQCIALDIPFYFTGTGANFRMRGRDFHIDKKFQESQARKAEMNYFPLSRAMNPPVPGADTASDDPRQMRFRSSGIVDHDSANKSVRNSKSMGTSYRETASDDLRALGFRSMNSSDSFNPFLEESEPEKDAEFSSQNPFLNDAAEENTESSVHSETAEDHSSVDELSGTELRIPHINYDIEIEDEDENEFLSDDSGEETLSIPGINYEVTVEKDPSEYTEKRLLGIEKEMLSECGEINEDAEALSRNFKVQDMDELFSHLSRSKFRSGFHLHKLERDYFTSHGEDTIRKHASDFISQRLAPAEPANDGKQTPTKGHPVFIAQHATACCCRGCLKKWHHIPEHRELSKSEQNYVVDVIMKWIERDMKDQ
ncbi:Phage protein Gp37/Gp68 [Lachnospiraceae bacterium JC7]|nr:Phage protein Gp37/Gp68 [Lachnospiraceae bacterium JC7]